jgi:hypothetical protein
MEACMHSGSKSLFGWAGALGLLWVTGAAAHDLTATECREGGEFIEHAAMSRDQGLGRDEFLNKMEEDIRAIQMFPPDLRWFVQDETDQALLLGAAQQVFDAPRTPEDHRNEFVQACAEHQVPDKATDAGLDLNR